MSSGLNKNCLTDKTILITGAGSGIGKAAAITYASHGATVILLGKTSSKLEKVYDEIEKLDCPAPSISLMDLLIADASDYQELIVIKKNANTLNKKVIIPVRFVPMIHQDE